MLEGYRRLAPSQLERERIVSLGREARAAVRLSQVIERSVYLYGLHEYLTAKVFCILVRPGMTVADVGANFGQYTLLGAARAGSQGRVMAFEPNPKPRARLLNNVALNGFANVSVFECALSDRSGLAELHVPTTVDEWNEGWGSLVAPEVPHTRLEVEMTTLDAIVDRVPGSGVDVIKVDVEGQEAAFLRGAAWTLSSDRPAVIFEVNGLDEAGPMITSESMDMLLALDYDLYGMRLHPKRGPFLHRLRKGEDPRPYQEPFNALNLVALHPSQAIRFLSRLQ
jgi:FkbM family methyltransferase